MLHIVPLNTSAYLTKTLKTTKKWSLNKTDSKTSTDIAGSTLLLDRGCCRSQKEDNDQVLGAACWIQELWEMVRLSNVSCLMYTLKLCSVLIWSCALECCWLFHSCCPVHVSSAPRLCSTGQLHSWVFFGDMFVDWSVNLTPPLWVLRLILICGAWKKKKKKKVWWAPFGCVTSENNLTDSILWYSDHTWTHTWCWWKNEPTERR